MGADDIPFSALTHPPLSTVRLPRGKLGRDESSLIGRDIDSPLPGRRAFECKGEETENEKPFSQSDYPWFGRESSMLTDPHS